MDENSHGADWHIHLRFLVAGAFFGIPLCLGLAEHLRAYVPEGVGIAAVFFLPMVVMGLAMTPLRVP
jgi:hypothetical protein